MTPKAQPQKRLLGTLKGKIQVREPEWWKPMPHSKVDSFVEERDQVRLLLDRVVLIFAVESTQRLTKRANILLQNAENILAPSAFPSRNRYQDGSRQTWTC